MSNHKGFTLLEVLFAGLISVLLMVPTLQGLAGAYRTFKTVQMEQDLTDYTRFLVTYYQEFYHNETQGMSATTGTNLATDPATDVNFSGSELTSFQYQKKFIGPPVNATSFYPWNYYVSPAIGNFTTLGSNPYHHYLIGVQGLPDPDDGIHYFLATFVVTAYYQNQFQP